MLVRTILETKKRSGKIIGLSRDRPVAEAVRLMDEHDTGSVVVHGEHDKLEGIITFREVLHLINKDPAKLATMPVSEIMDSDPAVATPDDTVDQLRQLMISHHLRYLPVMDNGKLTDVISFYDVARAVAKQSDFENRMLKQYITNWPEDAQA